MSAEANEQLLARYVREVWDEGDLDALERFLSPDFKRHVSPTLPPLDRNGQIERLRGFRSAFPDITLTVEDVVAGEDRVAFLLAGEKDNPDRHLPCPVRRWLSTR